MLRRWTFTIWFARFFALYSCVMFAYDFVRGGAFWAGALQVICLGVNVINIAFCLKQRRRLQEFQRHFTGAL
jgi:hypothetical protein